MCAIRNVKKFCRQSTFGTRQKFGLLETNKPKNPEEFWEYYR